MSDGGRGPEAAPFTALSHLQLLVSDVGASAAWYREALGLEGFAEDLPAGYVALRHRPTRVVVVLTARPDGRGAAGDGGGTLDHVALAVPDGDTLQRWAEHLTCVGIGHGGVVSEDGRPSLQLVDPDGTTVELVAPAPWSAPGGGSPPRPGPEGPEGPEGPSDPQ